MSRDRRTGAPLTDWALLGSAATYLPAGRRADVVNPTGASVVVTVSPSDGASVTFGLATGGSFRPQGPAMLTAPGCLVAYVDPLAPPTFDPGSVGPAYASKNVVSEFINNSSIKNLSTFNAPTGTFWEIVALHLALKSSATAGTRTLTAFVANDPSGGEGYIVAQVSTSVVSVTTTSEMGLTDDTLGYIYNTGSLTGELSILPTRVLPVVGDGSNVDASATLCVDSTPLLASDTWTLKFTARRAGYRRYS